MSEIATSMVLVLPELSYRYSLDMAQSLELPNLVFSYVNNDKYC